MNPDDLGTSPDAWWTDAYLWGASQLGWMLEWGVALLVLWLGVKLTKYLLLTLMAPVMSACRRRAKAEVGSAPPFNAGQLLRDLLRGVRPLRSCCSPNWACPSRSPSPASPHRVRALAVAPRPAAGSWMVGFFWAAVWLMHEQDGLDWRTSIRRGWLVAPAPRHWRRLLRPPPVSFVGVFLATYQCRAPPRPPV